MIKKLTDPQELHYYEVAAENPIFIRLEPPKGKYLYHYTTNLSAKNILNTNCFWVTRSDYLDDKLEIKYISTILDDIIMYLNENRNLYDVGVDGQYNILNSIMKTLEALREIYAITTPITDSHMYFLSLTENKNNKFLFKNYSGENGVILEFNNDIDTMDIGGANTMFKDDKFAKFYISTFCARVIYNCEKQITIILEEINEFYRELITNLLSIKGRIELDEQVIETIKTVIYLKIINYAIFFKHEQFSEEEECRIAFLVADKYINDIIKRRKKENKMIPYIEVQFKKENLSDVIYRQKI